MRWIPVVVTAVVVSHGATLAAGWQLARRRPHAPCADESLDEARRALVAGEWERARVMAGDAQSALTAATRVREGAERRERERATERELLAAVTAGDDAAAMRAYDELPSGALTRARYAALRAELSRRATAARLREAERLADAHACAALRNQVAADRSDDGRALAAIVARCERERSLGDLLRDGEADPVELTLSDRVQLLAARGDERPRALRLLGTSWCEADDARAWIVRRSLDAADRRAFDAGCAAIGRTPVVSDRD